MHAYVIADNRLAEMVRVCSQCHAPEIAAQQALEAEGWKVVINQMADNGALRRTQSSIPSPSIWPPASRSSSGD
jgi:hypothetical protein